MKDLEQRVSDVINEYNICDLVYMYVKQEQQNAKLVEALEYIVTQTNHVPYSESDASMTIYNVCNVAKRRLAGVEGE